MIAVGVIDAVVAILNANVDHSGVQRYGIGCLSNLACHNDAAEVRPVSGFGFHFFCCLFFPVCVLFLYAGYHSECWSNSTDFGSDETASRRRRDAEKWMHSLE
jgi:hypothetical protein